MTTYMAPVKDMRFVLEELVGLDEIAALPGYEEVDAETVEAILEEAGRFAGEVLAPLNKPGDVTGAKLDNGRVTVPDGFAEAYAQYVEGGWNGVSSPAAFGGMGLPHTVATPTQEMWQSANMSFGLCPLLTAGAVEALTQHGSEAQQAKYLEKLTTGEWTGTMDLTEPQAGSDLSAVRTRAVPEGEHYRLHGQKIYITWGEHEMAENIIHLVLARTPDAPEGVKGISLFIVPKYLVGDDGALGERNDMHCVSIEHKLGIHASPTCTMSYGDHDGAIGYLVGEEGRGLQYMFTMMNEARHKVGLQGLAISERAYQQARAYALDRVQGFPVGSRDGQRVTIVHHPDVRRMLMTMKSLTEAMRALAYDVAAHMDLAQLHPDDSARHRHQRRVDLLIPVVKGWSTELGVEVSSLGVQVHGGMGFIEETGACQYLRDSRIAPIYEGTNGIQANDLVGRKLIRDGGEAMWALIDEMEATEMRLKSDRSPDMQNIDNKLGQAVAALREATQWLLEHGHGEPVQAAANSHHYMMLTGYACGAWYMARAAEKAAEALKAGSGDGAFYQAKLGTARFYAEQMVPRALAHAAAVQGGGDAVMALTEEQL